jgi:AAA15 family ATPase/GTPase
MYIDEITLEGFKSYATRVNVPNFDPFFNAITGLNGSGKSNILDSICFVLGITNLSQARSLTPATFPQKLHSFVWLENRRHLGLSTDLH